MITRILHVVETKEPDKADHVLLPDDFPGHKELAAAGITTYGQLRSRPRPIAGVSVETQKLIDEAQISKGDVLTHEGTLSVFNEQEELVESREVDSAQSASAFPSETVADRTALESERTQLAQLATTRPLSLGEQSRQVEVDRLLASEPVTL